jgi:membrane dipeptidase
MNALNEFPPILDGHEDFITQASDYQDLPGGTDLEERPQPRSRDFLAQSERGHVDLPRAKQGGIGGAFASIWMRNADAERDARGVAAEQVNDLLRTIDRSEGRMRLVRDAAQLRACLAGDGFGAIMHFEGADPISEDLRELRWYYEAGLRSLGIVWSRSTVFGHGVQLGRGYQPPTSGLTDAGKHLVEECNRLGIVVDVSHLNEAGFWDVASVATKPFIASHSDAFAISPHQRNLTDEQIRAIAKADGAIGINLANSFIRPDRGRETDTTLAMVVAHIDHIVGLVGDRHIAIGTDFDGTDVPEVLADATKLPLLLQELRRKGYSDAMLEQVTHGNFVRVLEAVWK